MGGELAAHRSENMAILKVRTSRDPVLVRCLHFFCAQHDNRISATHIAGAANGPADALSRHNRDLFFAFSPKALPGFLEAGGGRLALHHLLRSFFRQASPPPQASCIPLHREPSCFLPTTEFDITASIGGCPQPSYIRIPPGRHLSSAGQITTGLPITLLTFELWLIPTHHCNHSLTLKLYE